MKRKKPDSIVLEWARTVDKESYELRERGDEDNMYCLGRVQVKPDTAFNDGWHYSIYHPEIEKYGGAQFSGYGATFQSAMSYVEAHHRNSPRWWDGVKLKMDRSAVKSKHLNQEPVITKRDLTFNKRELKTVVREMTSMRAAVVAPKIERRLPATKIERRLPRGR